jgi:signal peptidase I
VRRLVVTAAVTVLAVLALGHWVARPYRVTSASMEPTLHCARATANCLGGSADSVLVNRLARHPGRGQVVVVRLPAEAARRCGAPRTLVKRVVGLPGEIVGEHAGVVSIDGKPLREPYLDLFHRDHASGGRWPVPKGAYFVLGDNRADSCDSRTFGAVAQGDVVGEAVAVVWPPGRIKRL